MASRLAPTTFLAGATETMATADVYAATGKSVITKVTNIIKRFDTSVGQLLSGGVLSSDSIAVGVKDAIGATGMSVSEIKDRLSGLTTEAKTAINAIPGISESVASIKDYREVTTTIGGVASQINSRDFEGINAIGNFFNKWTKMDLIPYIDSRTTAGFVTALLEKTVGSGATGFVNSVLGSINDVNVIRKVVSNLSTYSIKAGDLTSLVDMSNYVPSGFIAARTPDAISTIAKNYTIPSMNLSGGSITLADEFSKIITVFNNIDPQWDANLRQTTTGDVSGLKIVDLLEPSEDFRTVFCGGIRENALDPSGSEWNHRDLILLTQYSPSSVLDKIKTYFPMTAIVDQTVMPLTVVDARWLGNLS